jgi:hypothetical protein
MKETASRYELLLEEQRVEREDWERARQEFREQCLKIGEVSQSLRSAQANLTESHNSEKEQWNLQRQELEQKLRAAEQELSNLHQAIQSERTDWDLKRTELEQKHRTAEESCAGTTAALQEAESGLARLAQSRCAPKR